MTKDDWKELGYWISLAGTVIFMYLICLVVATALINLFVG